MTQVFIVKAKIHSLQFELSKLLSSANVVNICPCGCNDVIGFYPSVLIPLRNLDLPFINNKALI